MRSFRAGLGALVVVALLGGGESAAGGATVSGLRPPTSAERRAIVAEVRSAYRYESDVSPYGRVRMRALGLLPLDPSLRLGPLHLHVRVARVRVSRADPWYAAAVIELRDARGHREPGTVVLVLERGPDPGGEPWAIVAESGTSLPAPCAATNPRGIRDLACPGPWATLRYARPSVRLNTRVAMPIRTSDLHRVDWGEITLPGAACGASRPIRLRYSESLVHSAVRPWLPGVFIWVDPRSVVYGDLDGDGRDEAAVSVSGSTTGGGASSGLFTRNVSSRHEGTRCALSA